MVVLMNMKQASMLRVVLTLLFGSLLSSCHAASQVDDNHARIIAKSEQQRCRIVIGQKYQDHLEYLDALSNFAFQSAPLPLKNPTDAANLNVNQSGQNDFTSQNLGWKAHCTDNVCLISGGVATELRIQIQRKSLLTPLFPSPDGKLIFYVVKGPTWRSPARCSLEDERDITLVDLTSGKQGVVRTVCGGFPYEILRWYDLSSPK
jgi:hypothetical protein